MATSFHPTDLITVTRLGRTFKASRRTVAHLDYTIAAFARKFPKARLVIIQPCYNTGVAASAHTHDYDAVFDFGFAGSFPGLTAARKWRRFSIFMRNHGWGGWWRHTGSWAAPSEWHFHGFTLPADLLHFATRVGTYIDGGLSSEGRVTASSQLADYLGGALGLAGQHKNGSDTAWRPKNLRSRVFDYDRWVRANPWVR